MTLATLALTQAVKARAHELGFDRVAIGPADPPAHAAAFERWLDAGHAGTMAYLERGRADRLDPQRLLPGARSVVALALTYRPQGDGVDGRPVARYARGLDYHDVMRPRLAALVALIDEATGSRARSRAAVDTSAMLERELAAQAGLGWIGKNTMLLTSADGSYFFIGIVLTTVELEHDLVAPDRCGSCRRCLDACPTQAFMDAYVLDARRCISYLTIEHRGDVPEPLRARLEGWIFGCDICQEVCPWNRKTPSTKEAVFADRGLEEPAALLALDAAAFRGRFRGRAISRAKRSGLLRNAALLLGARRDASAVPLLERAALDADDVVRRAAEWALDRIRRAG